MDDKSETRVVPRISLRSDLPSDQIRAVPLSVCLAGWGKHFKTQGKEAMFRVQKEQFDLSQPTTSIDMFLSHDWATGRWWKFLTLTWVFNSRAAVIATCLVSLAVGALRAATEGSYSPRNFWPMMFCYATFVVVLICWQRLPFGKDPKVFLDRLCIAQHDDALKTLGILGIASFLRNSKELTVLWSENWISRLWCVYELATFLSDGNKKPLNLIPVKLSSVLLLQFLCWMLLSTCWIALTALGGASSVTGGVASVLCASFGLVVLPSFCYLMFSIVEELDKLAVSMRRFRIQEVQCYCCSNHHRHPLSGEEIPCDRELVYAKLRSWFSSKDSGDVDTAFLDRFNTLVQKELSSTVLANVASVPFSFAICVAGAGSFPLLSDYIPWWVHSELTGVVWFLWFIRGFCLWSHGFLVQLAMVRIYVIVARCFLRLRTTCRSLIILLQVPLVLLLASLLFFPSIYAFHLTDTTDMLILVPWTALLLLNLYLYWPRVVAAEAPCAVGEASAEVEGDDVLVTETI